MSQALQSLSKQSRDDILRKAALEALKRKSLEHRVISRLPEPHPNQRAILDSGARFRVVVCGRRFGKTELGKREILQRALRGQQVWYLALTYRLAKQVWREMIPALRQEDDIYLNNSDLRAEFPSGGWLQMVTAQTPDNLRGAGLDFVVLDEAAFMDAAIWGEVVRPMLLTSEGSALFITSPNGRNWLHTLYAMSDAQWQSFHYTSYDNPLIRHSEIDDIKRNTPQRVFEQEYMAQFLEDGGAVFRNIQACIGDVPEDASRVVFGVDWGRHNDYTVITAIDTKTRTVVEVDRFNQIDWSLQRGRLQAMAQRWRPFTIIAEANSIGEPNAEELQRAGLPVQLFTTTASSKQGLINALSLAFEQADITIPKHEALIGELQAYTIERLPSGNLRYTAPQGMHDDCVMSLALAWHGVQHASHSYFILD